MVLNLEMEEGARNYQGATAALKSDVTATE